LTLVHLFGKARVQMELYPGWRIEKQLYFLKIYKKLPPGNFLTKPVWTCFNRYQHSADQSRLSQCMINSKSLEMDKKYSFPSAMEVDFAAFPAKNTPTNSANSIFRMFELDLNFFPLECSSIQSNEWLCTCKLVEKKEDFRCILGLICNVKADITIDEIDLENCTFDHSF